MPAPKLGRGLLLSLLFQVAALPTVPLCWLFAVFMRLKTVGFRSNSPIVDCLVIPISRRVTEPSEEDVATDEPDVVLSRLSLLRFGDMLSNRLGEASLSASAISLSTMFIAID